MRLFWILSTILTVLTACNFSGVGDEQDGKELLVVPETPELVEEIMDSVVFDNAISIKYYKHGDGDTLKKGNVVWIDYNARLKSGKSFDNNSSIGKPIPFLVGWRMQTKGWDFVFNHLRIGDDVEVFLPAEWARGKKGIPGQVPPNADNWVRIQVREKLQPYYTEDGVKLYLVDREKNSKPLKEGDELEFEFIAFSESKPRYSSSIQNGAPFSFKLGSGANLPGLNMALKKAHYGDKLLVHIPTKYAFGKQGSVGTVKPNEDVFFDILIVQP